MEALRGGNMEIKFGKLSPLDNMMCNIMEEGIKEVWNEIETIKNPINRCKERNLFAAAIKKGKVE